MTNVFDSVGNITIKSALQWIVKHAAYFTFIGGICGFVVKPYAEDFIDKRVDTHQYVTRNQLNDIIKSIDKLSGDQERLNFTIQGLGTQDTFKTEVLKNLTESQENTSRDIRIILREIQNNPP